MLHEITHDPKLPRNRFCGPAALSAIFGITAEAAADRIAGTRHRRGRVAGVTVLEMEKVIANLGGKIVERESFYHLRRARAYFGRTPYGEHRELAPTLVRWRAGLTPEQRDGTWLIVVARHFIVVGGGWVADSAYRRRAWEEYPCRRQRVKLALRVEVPA